MPVIAATDLAQRLKIIFKPELKPEINLHGLEGRQHAV